MEIRFVRHGETDWNVEGRLQGQTDEPKLTSKGLKQIDEITRELKKFKYDIIISSPLSRALKTAENIDIISNVIIDDRLAERSYGDLEGKYNNGIDYNIEQLWDYTEDYNNYKVESVRSFFGRIYGFLDELSKKDYKSVLLVSHSGVAIALRTYFEGFPTDMNLLSLGINNCEVITYNTLDDKKRGTEKIIDR